MYWKRSNPNCNGNSRDKLALRATCNKNVKFKVIKIRTGCQCVSYLYYCGNLNWLAQNLWLGRMLPAGRGLDMAGLKLCGCFRQLKLLFRIIFNIFLAVNHCYWKSCWHCLCIIIPYLSFLAQLGLPNRCPLYETESILMRNNLHCN